MDENIGVFKYIDTPYIKRKNKFIDLFGDKINNNRFIKQQNYPKKVENIKIIFLIRKN